MESYFNVTADSTSRRASYFQVVADFPVYIVLSLTVFQQFILFVVLDIFLSFQLLIAWCHCRHYIFLDSFLYYKYIVIPDYTIGFYKKV